MKEWICWPSNLKRSQNILQETYQTFPGNRYAGKVKTRHNHTLIILNILHSLEDIQYSHETHQLKGNLTDLLCQEIC